MSNSKEPLKKYQSIASHIEDMESRLDFKIENNKYAVASWARVGERLYLSACTLPEKDAIDLAHWILRMTEEETYNNE